MNKKFIVALVAIMTVAGAGLLYAAYVRQAQSINTQSAAPYPPALYQIHEIKQQKLGPGTFNTEGYIVKTYTCPPCPAEAECKPCMRNNIVISEYGERINSYSLPDTAMILFTDDPKQFAFGTKYNFWIRILDSSTTNEPINDVEILSFNVIKGTECLDCGADK